MTCRSKYFLHLVTKAMLYKERVYSSVHDGPGCCSRDQSAYSTIMFWSSPDRRRGLCVYPDITFLFSSLLSTTITGEGRGDVIARFRLITL